MTAKHGELPQDLNRRQQLKFDELAQLDDEERETFIRIMYPNVPQVPANYYLNAAAFPPTAYNNATAEHVALAWALHSVTPNDRVTAKAAIEKGEVKQSGDPVSVYFTKFDSQFAISGLTDAVYKLCLVKGLNNNLPSVMKKGNEKSLYRLVTKVCQEFEAM